jgi:hypothetical protein
MHRNSAEPDKLAMQALGDSVTVRGRLALLGWRSLTAWAEAHGFTQDHTHHAIKTWGRPRADKRKGPHGGMTQAILRELLATLTEQRRPSGHVEC